MKWFSVGYRILQQLSEMWPVHHCLNLGHDTLLHSSRWNVISLLSLTVILAYLIKKLYCCCSSIYHQCHPRLNVYFFYAHCTISVSSIINYDARWTIILRHILCSGEPYCKSYVVTYNVRVNMGMWITRTCMPKASWYVRNPYIYVALSSGPIYKRGSSLRMCNHPSALDL